MARARIRADLGTPPCRRGHGVPRSLARSADRTAIDRLVQPLVARGRRGGPTVAHRPTRLEHPANAQPRLGRRPGDAGVGLCGETLTAWLAIANYWSVSALPFYIDPTD